ncbi:MAG TPA: hypothetical protein VGD24_08440 [Gallionella sp.]
MTADKVDAYLRSQEGYVACVVGFGANPVANAGAGHTILQVDMPVYELGTVYEVWTTDKPVTPYREGGMTGAVNEDVFFGSIAVEPDGFEDLSAAAQRAFTVIFDFLQRSDYPNLIRVWNYFPWINAVENGLERYRSFSVGRHEAFVRSERSVEDSPAACALGSYGGPLVVYFLASRFQGVQIENPRQVSAYSYPQQYGPRSPTFSRATLAYRDDPRILFVSGTASIVGHETVHPDSVSMQTRETLANIRAVIEQAVLKGFPEVDYARDMALKVYVRHTQDIPVVMEIVRAEYGLLSEVIALQADICRTDLLVEIEAVCWSPSR